MMMPKISDVRQGPKDFIETLRGVGFHQEARAKGISVHRALEEAFPEAEYKDGLTPLARLMAEAELFTRTDLAEGIYAAELGKFDASEGTRFLLHTYMSQVWENAINGQRVDQAAIMQQRVAGAAVNVAGDQPYGTTINPYIFDDTPHIPLIAPQIPLAALVAVTTPIAGGVYQGFFLLNDPVAQRLVRVAQGAELPRAKLVGTNHTVQLHKYGRMIEFSYELARRQRIDLIALHVARIAIQAESDRVAAVADVLVNGDGNPNTAALTYNLTALDPAAVVGTLTLKAWLSYKLKFPNPYKLTTALANEAYILQLELLNTGTANIPLVYFQSASGLGSFDLINPQLRDAVTIGVSSDTPVSTIVGFDARYGIQRLTEIGGDLTEVDRFISRQVQALAISYVDGYAVFDQNATRILNLAA